MLLGHYLPLLLILPGRVLRHYGGDFLLRTGSLVLLHLLLVLILLILGGLIRIKIGSLIEDLLIRRRLFHLKLVFGLQSAHSLFWRRLLLIVTGHAFYFVHAQAITVKCFALLQFL